MSCRTGQTCFLTFINGAFALLIPAALLIASGGDVRTALVNLIFYALFAPACGQMINRIMYMSEAVMEADEAIGRLDEILSQQPMEEPEGPKKGQLVTPWPLTMWPSPTPARIGLRWRM